MFQDNNKELYKLDGVVEGVAFRNADNGFTVLDVSVDNELITAVGTFAEIGEGEQVTLFGRWDNHSTFGRQFRVDKYEAKMPETVSQLLRYLSSGMIKGIGPKLAVRIIEKFGEDSFEVLENNPSKLATVKGISERRAEELCNEYRRQFSIRTIMMTLEKYGITPMESIEIFRQLGANAVEILRKNPYLLCMKVRGFDFYRADFIAEKFPEKPEDEYRMTAGVLYVLKHNLYNGHTCLPREKLIAPSCQLLSVSEELVEICIDNAIEAHLITAYEYNNKQYLFLPNIFVDEKRAADRLLLMRDFPAALVNTLLDDIAEIEEKDGVAYNELQRKAIIAAVSKGLLILTGGPGTGKTTTVKGIISLFEKYGYEIVLTAPTGRAAKRMTELTGREASTIHRLLEVEWDKNDEPIFSRNMQNPLAADVVIVDELSMVDISLFASLLDAIPIGCRLIMVGDCDQLPPVGAGNVLLDMVKSDIFPVIRLTQVFRQAQRSLIVMNAHRIVSGEMPKLDVKDADFFFMERNSSMQAAETIAALCAVRLPNAYGFDKYDIQVLCPSRKGDCGSVNLNTRLQAALNPKHETKQEYVTQARVYRVGDKVMQVKNNYDLVWKKGDEDGTGIYNGDIGIIQAVSHASATLKIAFDDKLCSYPFDKCSELEHAFAITVHKSQGSEFPAVVIPIVDASNQLLYRNLLYTAVTRAKRLLILVGNKAKVFDMINNNKKNRRYSALDKFLEED